MTRTQDSTATSTSPAELIDRAPTMIADGSAVDRMIQTQLRRLKVDSPLHLAGERIMVTGGTGCVGAEVIRQLAKLSPRPLIVSVSRGLTLPRPEHLHVHYEVGDVRSMDDMRRIIDRYQPTVILHLAAQRDPGLAEQDPIQTVDTNLRGVVNVVTAAAEFGVQRLVAASTGKALRLMTHDVYAFTKQLGECALASMAQDLDVAVARFTHIVDNSLIWRKLHQWTRSGEDVLLHGKSAFYVQSAMEAADLILALTDGGDGGLRIAAQRDLGEAVELVRLAADVRHRNRSQSAIRFIGHEQGYEEGFYPGTYDVLTAGDFSPLLNSIEVDFITGRAPAYDVAIRSGSTHGTEIVEQFLARALNSGDVADLRDNIIQTAPALLRWRLRGALPATVARAVRAAAPADLGPLHREIDASLRGHLAMSSGVDGPTVAW